MPYQPNPSANERDLANWLTKLIDQMPPEQRQVHPHNVTEALIALNLQLEPRS